MVPSNFIKGLLTENWKSENVKKPTIVEVNVGPEAIARYDFRRNDHIFIQVSSEGETETYRDVAYADNTFGLELHIVTAESRERLYDLRTEVRRIFRTKRLDLGTDSDYQLLRYLGFTESVMEEMKIWRGTARVRFEAIGIYVTKGW